VDEVMSLNPDFVWPSVSVVMPVRNEARHIASAVQAVLTQYYEGDLDIWIAVAPSDDGTEILVRELVEGNANIFSVENPDGVTPSGLNAAISASAGEVIVRVDGHVRLCDGYIATAVKTMAQTGAVNVGGRQLAVGSTGFEKAVAAVMMSFVGSGGAEYRVGEAEKSVDTVFLGVFDRKAGDEVGWFDETLIRNQDYELNIRLRKAGGTIWYNPALAVEYQPRSSLRAVARQYFDYGRYKAHVVRLHGSSLRLRQFLPPVATFVLALSILTSLWVLPALSIPLGYLVIVAGGVKGPVWVRLRALAIAPVMHFSWSFGLLKGFLKH
jgi:succinoglycan biosynthesis protein ExoA